MITYLKKFLGIIFDKYFSYKSALKENSYNQKYHFTNFFPNKFQNTL